MQENVNRKQKLIFEIHKKQAFTSKSYMFYEFKTTNEDFNFVPKILSLKNTLCSVYLALFQNKIDKNARKCGQKIEVDF